MWRVGVLLMLAFAAPAAGAPAAAPLIVFESGQSGDFELWTMRLDGTALHRLTHAKGEDTVPAWSRDGRRIAFISSRTTWPKLWLMNADGSRQHALTRGYTKEGTPEWTRAGALVFPSNPDAPRAGAHVWWSMRADGTHRQPVSPGYGSPPSFSPDGRRAVFSAPCPSGYSTCVYSSNATGGDRHALTTEHLGSGEQPAWSPDGHAIAFIGNNELWIMNADGSQARQLAPGPLPETYDSYPSWSPDGSRLVFGTNRSPTGIAVINRDGTGLVPIGAGVIRGASRPAWQPQ